MSLVAATYPLPAWDAHIVLVDVLQLIQRAVSRVVKRFECILFNIQFLPNEAGNADSLANVLVAILVSINTQGDGEAILSAVGANPSHLPICLLDLLAFEVFSVSVIHTISAHILVLGTGVVLRTHTLQVINGIS